MVAGVNREQTIDRFWSRVTKGPGCWKCSTSRGSHGYAQVTGFLGKTVTAHRFSYELAYGPTKLWVLHKCGEKTCVRPDHLYAGTHMDNMADVAAVGHPRRKLSDDAVRAIRESTLGHRELGAKYGVSAHSVFNVKKRITYRFVQD